MRLIQRGIFRVTFPLVRVWRRRFTEVRFLIGLRDRNKEVISYVPECPGLLQRHHIQAVDPAPQTTNIQNSNTHSHYAFETRVGDVLRLNQCGQRNELADNLEHYPGFGVCSQPP
jgi:hypothetical protein